MVIADKTMCHRSSVCGGPGLNPALSELIWPITYGQSHPWTPVLPPFYKMCSELIYIYKDWVHQPTTPADQSISCYNLSSTYVSFNRAQGGPFLGGVLPRQEKPHVEIPSRGCDAESKQGAEIRGSNRN